MRSKKRSSSHSFYICSVIFLTICCSVGVQAQNIFGRISGTVSDPAGAVVPNTKITITNEATKVARTATTDGSGFYAADDLLTGTYSVTAETNGFKTIYQAGIGLAAGQRVTVNLNLEVGAASETV